MNRYTKTINKVWNREEYHTVYYKASDTGLYTYNVGHKTGNRRIMLDYLVIPSKDTDLM